MKLVVTGASGYIGERLMHRALRTHEVIAATRRPLVGASGWLPYDLASNAPLILPLGTDAIVHLAADTKALGNGDDEVRAARLLLAAARETEARIVFVSSQTARPNAPTSYGRTKWRIEQEILAAGGWAIRPGLVYGGAERGLFGTLVQLVRRFPLLPALVPAPMVQPIHVDDLVEALLGVCQREDLAPGVLRLASSEPLSFTRFLGSIAKERVRKPRFFVPFPVWLIKGLGILLGRRLRTRFGFERVLSLLDLPELETSTDLIQTGFQLRPACEGMAPARSERRALLEEGQAILTYVLDFRPRRALLKRYVLAVEQLTNAKPLILPSVALRRPKLLASLERSARRASNSAPEFLLRLQVGTLLAEATPESASRFLLLNETPRPLRSLVGILQALARELVSRAWELVWLPLLLKQASRSEL